VHDVQTLKRHVYANNLDGIDNEWLTPEQAKEFCPSLNIDPGMRYPVLGAALQRRAGTARHDAVAWGYARAASDLGVDIMDGPAIQQFRPHDAHRVPVRGACVATVHPAAPPPQFVFARQRSVPVSVIPADNPPPLSIRIDHSTLGQAVKHRSAHAGTMDSSKITTHRRPNRPMRRLRTFNAAGRPVRTTTNSAPSRHGIMTRLCA
jgi:hypothetical protein